MDLSNLSNEPFVRKTRRRVGRGSPGPAWVRPPVKGTRARRPVRATPAGLASKAARCRCTAVCRSAASGTATDSRWPWSTWIPWRNSSRQATEVTPEKLVAEGLVRAGGTGVKLLGRGELTKKLTVRVNEISPSAREKVEKAGGQVALIEAPTADAAEEGK